MVVFFSTYYKEWLFRGVLVLRRSSDFLPHERGRVVCFVEWNRRMGSGGDLIEVDSSAVAQWPKVLYGLGNSWTKLKRSDHQLDGTTLWFSMS